MSLPLCAAARVRLIAVDTTGMSRVDVDPVVRNAEVSSAPFMLSRVRIVASSLSVMTTL